MPEKQYQSLLPALAALGATWRMRRQGGEPSGWWLGPAFAATFLQFLYSPFHLAFFALTSAHKLALRTLSEEAADAVFDWMLSHHVTFPRTTP